MTLGQRIQQLRTAHALSQEELGAKLGTTRQTVSRWELDQTYPELAKIVLMSKLFSVTTDSLLVDGISTFDTEVEGFVCGVYRSGKKEIVETEKFAVDHSKNPLPAVAEAGISRCLLLWRMADSYKADAEQFHFFLCTGKTEYIFSIRKEADNIYCGASYNQVFDLGMFSGGQFFRIRNYKDNTEPFCRFYCDFSYEPGEIQIPTQECRFGQCVNTSKGLMWCVKRYTDEEIVLQGCGDDEYIYRRGDKRTEQFVPLEK